MTNRTIRSPEGTQTTVDRMVRLTRAVNNVMAEQMPDRKRALFHLAVNASIRVAHDRGDLADWLEAAWSWLDAHPDAPDFTAREDRWLSELDTYCQLSASLEDAKRILA